MTGKAICVQGDARKLPLPEACVDLIITSPPYFALRSYQDAGAHYDGQIGSEETPQAWLEAMWECTMEWARVLKPEGSIFVNLGDKYSGAQAQNHNGISNRSADSASFWQRTGPKRTGIPNKSLMGLPWRYALGCIDQLGLILRAEIIWAKPNGLPESVTDRVRRSHEQWFHFVKQPRYFAAVDHIREAQSSSDRRQGGPNGKDHRLERIGDARQMTNMDTLHLNPLGKLPGSVWTIPTEPLQVPEHLGVDHFAAYPLEWPLRIIRGWSPSGICTVCGQGRRLVDKSYELAQATNNAYKTQGRMGGVVEFERKTMQTTITGEACACGPPFWQGPACVMCNGTGIDRLGPACRACNGHGREPSEAPTTTPALIVDPFGGTGTTALAARALGRVAVSVDLSHDYTRLARWRTSDPGQLAKAMRVEKPPVQVDGQLGMFDNIEPVPTNKTQLTTEEK